MTNETEGTTELRAKLDPGEYGYVLTVLEGGKHSYVVNLAD